MCRIAVAAAMAAFVCSTGDQAGRLACVLAVVYLLHSLATWLVLRRREVGTSAIRILHALDIAWAFPLALLPAEPHLVFTAFVVIAAAFRWDLPETIVTGIVVASSTPLAAAALSAGGIGDRPPGAAVGQAMTLLAISLVLAFVSRREKAIRAESSQAKAMDRALVARELHDGAIQSLIGMEVQVDVLRREAERESSPMGGELSRLQELLRSETLNLRELMQQMRPMDLDPKELPDFLARTVDRFWRDTGIAASFVSDLERVDLSPRICREVARIAQEALVNIRKHSGARNVVVRLGSGKDRWKLEVDDDGRGFDFEGRLDQSELDAARKGPVIIKERVRAIGGELTIDSTRGRGARLEITFPGAA